MRLAAALAGAVIALAATAAPASDSLIYLPVLVGGATRTPTPTATPTPTPTSTPTATPAPTATPIPGANVICTTSAAAELCAWVSDPTPSQNATVVITARFRVNGVGQPSQPMLATWHYRTSTPTCTGTTNAAGLASCQRDIGRATLGHRVDVDVDVGGLRAVTWFVPQ